MVHGTNVSNRVHGHLIDPNQVASEFGALVTDASRPGRFLLLADRAVFAPARIARDGLRSAAKSALLAVVGKSGLDSFKQSLARPKREVVHR